MAVENLDHSKSLKLIIRYLNKLNDDISIIILLSYNLGYSVVDPE